MSKQDADIIITVKSVDDLKLILDSMLLRVCELYVITYGFYGFKKLDKKIYVELVK